VSVERGSKVESFNGPVPRSVESTHPRKGGER
jgi:hypothetical protein